MKQDILIVGQTPPPYHGQAIMIEKLLEGTYEGVTLRHVRMAFSNNVSEVGRPGPGKVVELLRVIWQIVATRFRHHTPVMYYPPSGSGTVPMLRDAAILLSTKWLFKKVVFHFHGSGWAHRYDDLTGPMRWLFRWAYFRPDAGISMANVGVEEAERLQVQREFIVPYGVEDVFPKYAHHRAAERPADRPLEILFVGTVRESKGVNILVEACALLQARGITNFTAKVMGGFVSPEYEQEIRALVAQHGLEERVVFLGTLTGDAKYRTFAEADLFCFPTFYESEAFSVVLVEALSFGLPVVTTRWRSLPAIIGEDEACGYLLPPHAAAPIADKLAYLMAHPEVRQRMAANGRERYLDHFTEQRYHENLNRVFTDLLKAA